MITRRELQRIYRPMDRHYGNLHWWPGKTPLEISVGAILTQNTAWSNVEKAMRVLKSQRALSVHALSRITHPRLAGMIKAAGYFNVKARRLKHFIAFLKQQHGGSFGKMFHQPPEDLRRELLAVHGIGPETADSILLYAGAKPIFVIDAYTRRILSRHGVLPYERSYEEFQALFMERLPRDVPLYNQFHALFVNTGKDFCRTRPRCGACPLNGWRGVPPLKSP